MLVEEEEIVEEVKEEKKRAWVWLLIILIIIIYLIGYFCLKILFNDFTKMIKAIDKKQIILNNHLILN